jgi:succinyl-diaminopimelate desuccinylase
MKSEDLFDLVFLVNRYFDEMVSFCQKIIQTPSPSGNEGNVAQMISAEMEYLKYDSVWTDQWGNVIGLIYGNKNGKSVMFNGHMDHVDSGNLNDWPYPPFSGEIHKNRLWGRGTADMKGPLAAMIYACGLLVREGFRPQGDICICAVVQEEVGGLGTRKLLQKIHPDYAVVGEATGNSLALGHRGRLEILVRVQGTSVHASMPQLGVNPYSVVARFIQSLEGLKLRKENRFGQSTVVPTLIHSNQKSTNVTPSEITLYLDWRNIPGETYKDVVEQLQPLLDQCLAQVKGSKGELLLNTQNLLTWTGKTEIFPFEFPSYKLEEESSLVQRSRQILDHVFSRPVELIIWPFATDGGHLMEAGVPTIGFGPAEIEQLHTIGESVPLEMLREGMLGYVSLASELGKIGIL